VKNEKKLLDFIARQAAGTSRRRRAGEILARRQAMKTRKRKVERGRWPHIDRLTGRD